MNKKHFFLFGLSIIGFSCKKEDVSNPIVEEMKTEASTQSAKSRNGSPVGFEAGTKTSY